MNVNLVAVGAGAGFVGIAVGLYLGLEISKPRFKKLKLVILILVPHRAAIEICVMHAQVSTENDGGDAECVRWCLALAGGARL